MRIRNQYLGFQMITHLQRRRSGGDITFHVDLVGAADMGFLRIWLPVTLKMNCVLSHETWAEIPVPPHCEDFLGAHSWRL